MFLSAYPNHLDHSMACRHSLERKSASILKGQIAVPSTGAIFSVNRGPSSRVRGVVNQSWFGVPSPICTALPSSLCTELSPLQRTQTIYRSINGHCLNKSLTRLAKNLFFSKTMLRAMLLINRICGLVAELTWPNKPYRERVWSSGEDSLRW